MALVKLPAVRFATDQSMATITNTTGSQFRSALSDLLAQVAAGIIADSPSIIAAAEAAVADALTRADILTGPDPRSPRLLHDLPGYAHAFTDSAGRVGAASMRSSDLAFDDWVIEDIGRRLGALTQSAQGRAAFPIFWARLGKAQADGLPLAIAFAGSSTTANNGISDAQGYAWQFVVAVQGLYPASGTETATQHSTTADFTVHSAPGVHGYNAGVGGTTSADYLTDATATKLAATQPALIVHMVGSNDWAQNRNPDTYRAELLARIDYIDALLTEPAQHVFVHMYQRMDYASRTYEWEQYANAIREIMTVRNRVALVDLSGPFRTNGIPGDDPLDMLRTDLVHMYARGHSFTRLLLTDALGV